MSNSALDQTLKFGAELAVSAAFTGIPQLVGVLANKPVMIFFKNQSTVSVFIADNNGSTNGMTMVAGEEIVLDCRANHGKADNMGFAKSTAFYVTGTAGAGAFRLSYLYAI